VSQGSSVKREEQRRRIEAETQRCIDLYRELGSAGAVAAELGLKPRHVARRLRESGASPLHLRVERAVELYLELGDVRAVARRLRLSEEAVRNRLFSGVVLGLLEEMPGTKRSGHRLPTALEEKTVALYAELRSLRRVGERLGISQEAVRLRLRNAGVDTSRRDTLDEAERDQLVELYKHLGSVQAVERATGRGKETIRRVLHSRGVTIEDGRQRSTDDERAITRAHHLGQARVIQRLYARLGSEVAVAEALGISQSLVSNRLGLVGAGPGRGNHGPRAADPEKLARLRAEFDTGVSAREAARRSGVPYRTALRWLHRDGAPIQTRPGAGRPLETEVYLDTYQRYRKTYSPEKVADQIGRSRRTVNRRLHVVSRALEHQREGRDGTPPLTLLPPDEPPRDVPAWVNPEDVVPLEVNDVRELERSPRGAYICPLCLKKYWGREMVIRHLQQPHVRCTEPGCERAFLVGGVAAHRWNAHGGRAEMEALKHRQREETKADRLHRVESAGRRGEAVVLRRRDLEPGSAA
jgi:AraC-like DNA-binding protein